MSHRGRRLAIWRSLTHNKANPSVRQCGATIVPHARVLLFTLQRSPLLRPACFCRKSCRSPPFSSLLFTLVLAVVLSCMLTQLAWPAINSLTDTATERERVRRGLARSLPQPPCDHPTLSLSLFTFVPLRTLVPVSNGLSSSASPSDAEQRIPAQEVRPQRRRSCLSLSLQCLGLGRVVVDGGVFGVGALSEKFSADISHCHGSLQPPAGAGRPKRGVRRVRGGGRGSAA